MTTGSFGEFTSGTTIINARSDTNTGTYYIMPTAGSVTHINLFINKVQSGTQYVQCGLYERAPETDLKGTTGSIEYTSGTYNTWEQFTFATPIGLPAGSYGLISNSQQGTRQRVVTVGTDRSLTYADTFPISAANMSVYPFDWKVSINAEYTESGAEAPSYYPIITAVSPSGAGTITPSSGSATSGATFGISGTANDGYVFSEWTGDYIGSTNPVDVPIAGSTAISGIFTSTTSYYPITTIVSPAGAGTITPSIGSAISGTTFGISGVANAGYKFMYWSGDYSGTSTQVDIPIAGSTIVSGLFNTYHTITTIVSPVGAGTITPSAGSTLSGTTFGISGIANSDYRFTSWSGDYTGTTNPIDIPISKNTIVSGLFTDLYPDAVKTFIRII